MRLTTAGLAAAVLLAIGVTVWWPGEKGSPIVAQAQAQAPEGTTTGGPPADQIAKQQPSVEENNAITQRKLAQGVKDCLFLETPLSDVLMAFKDRHGVQFYMNRAALQDAGVDIGSTAISLSLKDVRLETALDLALQQAGGVLDYYIRDGVIMITTKESMESASEVRAYPVADLLKMHTPSPRPGGGAGFGGGGFGGGGMGGVGGGFFGETETPANDASDVYYVQFGGAGAAGGNPAGGQPATGTGAAAGATTGALGGVGVAPTGWHTSTAEDDLIDVIQKSVAPDSWEDSGSGSGTITYFGGMLVIRQSARAHREVEKVLSLLRETAGRAPGTPPSARAGDAEEGVKIFALKNTAAEEAMQILGRISKDGGFRVAIDKRTNSLIARGAPDQLAIVEALLLRLDEAQGSKPAEPRQGSKQPAATNNPFGGSATARPEGDLDPFASPTNKPAKPATAPASEKDPFGDPAASPPGLKPAPAAAERDPFGAANTKPTDVKVGADIIKTIALGSTDVVAADSFLRRFTRKDEVSTMMDVRTNSLIVRGKPDHVHSAEFLLTWLDKGERAQSEKVVP